MTIKIYELCGADETHLFSPHCWKTRYSLAHKGLEYEIAPTPFTQIASIEGGPNRTVPTIKDGETVLHESLEIALYLDKTYPDRPPLVGGEAALALTRFIVSWSQAQLHPEVTKICIMDIHDSLAPADQEFFRRTREARLGCALEEFSAKFPKDGTALNKALAPLDACLQAHPFIGGDSPLFADYIVFGLLQWLRLCSSQKIEIEGAVGKWFETLLDFHDGLGRKAA